MKIVFVTETLHPGGAELFVLRLAAAMQQKGNDVVIFSFYKKFYHKKLHDNNAPTVKVVHPKIPFNKLLQKTDSLFKYINLDLSLRNLFIIRSLRKLIGQFRPQVLHSNLFTADKIAIAVSSLPVVITIHGDYLELYKPGFALGLKSLINWEFKLTQVLRQVSKIVCISDEQLNFFTERFQSITKDKVRKIYNGYPPIQICVNNELRRKLNIPFDAFVFGMVARGEASKGWKIAIDAFLKLDNKDCHLILVGAGKHLNTLQQQFQNFPNIHFAGHTDFPLEWINIFDVGLLPSYSEGLPTVVIEYLYCGKPVVASQAGEIPNMIKSEMGDCGIIIPIIDNKLSVEAFSNAMFRLQNDSMVYYEFKRNTKRCFQLFNMEACVTAYEEVYESSVSL